MQLISVIRWSVSVKQLYRDSMRLRVAFIRQALSEFTNTAASIKGLQSTHKRTKALEFELHRSIVQNGLNQCMVVYEIVNLYLMYVNLSARRFKSIIDSQDVSVLAVLPTFISGVKRLTVEVTCRDANYADFFSNNNTVENFVLLCDDYGFLTMLAGIGNVIQPNVKDKKQAKVASKKELERVDVAHQ